MNTANLKNLHYLYLNMSIFEYRGLKISRDSLSCKDLLFVAHPYSFHLDPEGTIHIYQDLSNDPMAKSLEPPLKKIKLTQKRRIRSAIDKHFEDLKSYLSLKIYLEPQESGNPS